MKSCPQEAVFQFKFKHSVCSQALPAGPIPGARQKLMVSIILASTMGLSWIFGYFILLSDNAAFLLAMSWLFTIVNSSQVRNFIITDLKLLTVISGMGRTAVFE